jgi:hypothetical protein
VTTESANTVRDFGNLRWSTDRYAGGLWRAYAWIAGRESPTPFLWSEGHADELAALDGIRLEILRYYRGRGVRSADEDAVTNDQGHRINPGGGYR